MDNFGTSRIVHTIVWKEISHILEDIKLENHLNYIENKIKNKKKFTECVQEVTQWLMPIVDLTSFSQAYPTNGTHSALDIWLARETRPVYCLEGEYPYITSHNSKVTVVSTVNDIPKNCVVYMSNPFSATGSYDDRYFQISNPIVLDISYIGTTKPYKLTILPNVESVYWSISKPFGLGSIRAGLEFHKKEQFIQRSIFDTGYFSSVGVEIILKCIRQFGVTEKYTQYQSEYQKICKENSLTPSDSLLLATSESKIWDHFKRENGINRLPVAKILEEYIK